MLRLIVAFYWIFFSYQKWFDRSWVRDLLSTAAQSSYIPFYTQFLNHLALPNWSSVALGVTILEGAIGVMMLLGWLTRIAAALGTLLSLGLTFTFALCKCPWTEADFPLVFWFYFAPLLLNVQVIFDKSSNRFGLQRLHGKRSV